MIQIRGIFQYRGVWGCYSSHFDDDCEYCDCI